MMNSEIPTAPGIGWISLSRKLTPAQEAIADGEQNVIKSSDPAAHILFLKEFAKGFVPDLETNPSIDFAWMDDTVTENTTTVAYYMKSPLDTFDKEYIHLNGRALGSDKLDTMVTIAHEGYPGHLYAYVFAEIPSTSLLREFVGGSSFKY